MKLNGIFTAITTPFGADGSLAADRLRENISRYNRLPLAGYVAVGSTGESVLLTRAEVEQVFSAVREAAAPGRILIAGVGSESTPGNDFAVQGRGGLRLRLCARQDAQLLQVGAHSGRARRALPARGRCVQASRRALCHSAIYRRGARGGPGRASCRTSEHCRDEGKFRKRPARGRNHRRCSREIPGGGRDRRIRSTLRCCWVRQAGSWPSRIACPSCASNCIKRSPRSRTANARELNRRILPASKKIVRQLGIAGVKCAMDYRGYYGGPVRGPLLPLNAAQKREVEAVVNSLVATAAAD